MPTAIIAPLATALFDAFNQRDLSAWEAQLAPDAEFSYPGFRGDREAARAYNAPFLAAFSDLQFQTHYIVADGERSVAKITGRGTHDAPFVTPQGTVPASGRAIEVDGIVVVTTRNNLIVQEETYWDRASMLQQLGVDVL